MRRRSSSVLAALLATSIAAGQLRPAAAAPLPAAEAAPVVTAASAPTTAADDEATLRAKELFRQAELDYKEGRFAEALDGYVRAYEAKPLPGFVFNIGQCHMGLGNFDRAVFFYESFLKSTTDPKKQALAQARLDEARRELARMDKEQAAREAAERERLEEQRRIGLAGTNTGEPAQPIAPLPSSEPQALAATPPAQASAPFYATWWFWTLAGVVVFGAAAGLATQLGGQTRHALPSGDLGTIDAR